MDIEKLKQKILDLAIRGKLVPQDPNDEPASVLIEKIKAERAKLVKEGKIKKPKEESYIYKGSDNSYYENVDGKIININNEIPFSIPDNWSWIRLNELGEYKKGPFGSSLTKDMFVPGDTPKRIKVYEQKNAIQKDSKLGKYYISNAKFESMKGFVVEPGDIIVSCAGTIGEIYTLPNDAEVGIINQALMRVRLFCKSIEDYFLIYFDGILKKESSEKGNGTGMKNIPPFDVLKRMLIPLPPENEMKMILNKLVSINIYIEKISESQKDISKICSRIKTAILDNYFSGNGSYKSYYLKDLCKLTKSDEIFGEYPYLEAKVIRGTKNPILKKEGNFVSKNTPLILVDGENSGEIMFAPFDGYMGSTFRIVELIKDDVLIEYLYYFMLSKRLVLKENKKGSAIPHLNKKIFNSLLLPVPSKETQKEICSQIKQSFALLDKITS